MRIWQFIISWYPLPVIKLTCFPRIPSTKPSSDWKMAPWTRMPPVHIKVITVTNSKSILKLKAGPLNKKNVFSHPKESYHCRLQLQIHLKIVVHGFSYNCPGFFSRDCFPIMQRLEWQWSTKYCCTSAALVSYPNISNTPATYQWSGSRVNHLLLQMSI